MLTGPQYRQSLKIPHSEPGMRIGLFGGSFNPPHEGHLLVTEHALIRARLDQVWWLVTPGNPLKQNMDYPSLRERISLCHELAIHPRVKVTGLELGLGTRYTIDTLRKLTACRPRLKFVWLMGSDGLQEFDRWRHWREIAEMMPIVVVDRPGSSLLSRSSMAGRYLEKFRLNAEDCSNIADRECPSWIYIHGPRSPLSSTVLRNIQKI